MAIPSFAVAAGSSLTGFNNAGQGFRICIDDTAIDRQTPSQDVTQQGDTDTYTTPSTTVTAAAYRATKRQVMRLEGHGWYQTSGDGGSSWEFQYAAPGGVGGVEGAIQARVSQVVLQRNMGLINVTAANDPLPKTIFAYTKVSYGGSLRGHLLNDETPLEFEHAEPPATVTFPFGTGTVSAACIFDSTRQGIYFNRGGPHDLVTPFRLTGPISKANTPFDILHFDANLVLDNGKTLTGDALLSVLRSDVDYTTGGVIPFQFSGVISDFDIS